MERTRETVREGELLPCGHASSRKQKRKVPGAACWVFPDLVGEA